ncbi:protein SOGA1-like isoform X1 [Phyllopteryx taeniolatus]|uniref:protein SOGA1-like isoform X1 n=1 Tax=Phyllopteryx taeniolatus TaxID=161469 RepID=UPI002AD559B8|nr:protein SOGA1-like isoform X1 [Phyllopteryx taeniolatus]XP_061627347.1 protein SOGA1-like isoform X1 [Phyllopteryx taeniolatus]
MNREGDRCVKSAPRSQKPSSRLSQQGTVQRRKKESTSKDSQSSGQPRGTSEGNRGSGKDGKPTGKRPGGIAVTVCQRKLSDASNTSEDLSKDSGCLSGKPSSSDSSSEISDCTWEGNKRDSPISDNELSWTDGRVYKRPVSGGEDDAKEGIQAAGNACSRPLDAAAGGALTLLNSSVAFMDLMMAETSDDLVREVEDLRSENEYLRDEVEELRCEMLEMRDMFQEEETRQLQDLRQQLEQANKTCRILQYRLRKAERRSIRVAQTGQVDGELVRNLEHDIKVAKSVSLRLFNELEVVQKKNGQLDWENEMLREKTQELEVVKHVLQAELEKARESFLKRRSTRSTASKTERRLSQQIEVLPSMQDDSDLKCQLHFAKEELALMCKKLTKLVSESEVMHEQLARYHSAYGDVDASQSPEGKLKSAYAREAEVKVHLKLVEEEAMLLSRRIVELEMENRGLRAEMNDLRERDGAGGAEEEENRNVLDEHLSPSTLRKNRNESGQILKMTSAVHDERATVETEGQLPSCHITREGPVGGEWNPSDSVGNKSPDSSSKGMTVTDYTTLAALRDHSCILCSAIQLIKTTPKNGHCSSPSSALIPLTDGKTKSLFSSGPLNEALEVLQAMLQAFIMRMEVLLSGKNPPHQEGHVWGSCLFSALNGEYVDQDTISQGLIESATQQECVQVDVDERAKQTAQRLSSKWDLRMQLSMQILWILHQWCQESILEGKEAKDKRVTKLQDLLQRVGAELKGETLDGQTIGVQNKAAECAVSGVVTDEGHSDGDRICSSIRMKLKRQLSPHAYRRKNWCYLSQQASLEDQEQRVKTWDHLIMPLSFPDLDFEQMSVERSHTAPEKSALRIYYSPPSKRRVQLAQLKQSPESDRESMETQSPWCTPPTSFSTLCVGSSANLSDDMKEMAASWRQGGHSGSQVSRTRLVGRGVDVTCSGTQTHMRPLMVSVGLQTEGHQGPVTVRNSPSRVVNSSLISSHSRCVSTSLERLTSRTEKSRLSASSPKLYRSQSASGASSSLSSSFAPNTRRRTVWNHQSHSGPTSHRSAAGQNLNPLHSEHPGQNLKPPNKSAGGLVTEFLRRVSGRAERPVPGSAQKMNSGLERVPVRPSSSLLPRSDSVTRIVNHRFMRQREEVSRAPNEEKRRSRSNGAAYSLRSPVAEDGSYDCSSSSTLTFCFARPFRSTPRQTSTQNKVTRCQTAESDCE